MSDPLGLVFSLVYVAAIIAIAEGLRRSRKVSFDLSRKIVHVGIGTWILPTVFLFSTRWAAAGPPALFVLVNFLSLRGKWSRSFDAEAGNNIGTVLFPLSFVILLLLFWDVPDGKAATVAGILTLAWGDAAAALIGRRWGRRRYRTGDGWRSLEGSGAMFVFSLLAIGTAGALVGSHPYPPMTVLAAAATATLLEAVSRRGSDNLLVPVGTALFLWGMGQVG